MPFDRSRYPEGWEITSWKIRFERGQGRCECTGECGLHQERCNAEQGKAHPLTGSIVWLTCAHLGTPLPAQAGLPDGTPGDKHNKMDVRPENLKGMCQRCHLAFDLNDHIRNAARSRYQNKLDAGQLELL